MTIRPPSRDLTPGERGIVNRLREAGDKIASMEKHLAAERKRRDLLLLKGVTAGFSTRQLGAYTGISSPAVTYATRRAKEAQAARLAQEAVERRSD